MESSGKWSRRRESGLREEEVTSGVTSEARGHYGGPETCFTGRVLKKRIEEGQSSETLKEKEKVPSHIHSKGVRSGGPQEVCYRWGIRHDRFEEHKKKDPG